MRAARRWPGYIIAWLLAAAPVYPAAAAVHHALKVRLHPDQHTFQVQDTITLPRDHPKSLTFSLHAGLRPQVEGATLETLAPEGGADTLVPAERFRVTLTGARRRFVVRYGGKIYHPLAQVPSEERQFKVTAGLIDTRGTFLDSSSRWFPIIGDALVTFSLDVRLPAGWDAVSQCRRHRHQKGEAFSRVLWVCDKPQDDIYLVAARFHEYHRTHGRIQLQAFLRTPDEALARRYIRAAGRYIDRYQALLGPYPYGKFALVENFWQSGYGMPSFTLLGSQIIRFPFIIYTSYPHEILHNWWGNGVFVNFGEGNWSEGLTAYLSDQLVKVQEGKGADYRREQLQRYMDFVAGDEDFPLTAFTARNSQASEAVGYGKALMFFHMLHRRLGDKAFVKGLRLFYRDNKFRYATYDDLRRAFEKVSGDKLQADFDQWVRRTGAPDLKVEGVQVVQDAGRQRLRLTLTQTQPGPVYRLRVPVAVTLEGRAQAYQTTLAMNDKRQAFTLSVPAAPRRVDVDPQFDVFRRLSKQEIPPALSGLFGAESVLIVLPSRAPAPLAKAYRDLAQAWEGNPAFHARVVTDDELEALPEDQAVWLFGLRNRFRARAQKALSGYHAVRVSSDGDVSVAGQRFPAPGRSLVMAAARGRGAPLGWLMTTEPGALSGLAFKLPHYTKYSYLVFHGTAPRNTERGMWPVLHSPMSVLVDPAAGPVAMGRLKPRRPLTELIDTRRH